ncbi:TonB family protein [Imperialibacter roseus]|uniref:TonB family protein n=1 Tax=Imperialibacter roseus TaxID=1324217 RepID=A0ABZ0IS32_9BACT|nr:TonB family protein [Imperialibacter roseus]WOK07391.1 TonB family protein [Imperialibacter roseus]
MNNYQSYLIEANIGLLLFGLAYLVLLQKEQTFLLKRLLLLGMIAAAAFLPLLSFSTVFSSLATNQMSINGYYLPAILLTAEKASTPATPESISLLTICFWLYWVVVAVLLIQFILRITALLKQSSTGRFVKNIGPVKVYEVDSTDYAFSFFNLVFIGQLGDLNENAKNKIIAHELVHYKEWHSLDILFVELLRILFWFNPSIYVLKNALVEAHEYRADELSVREGEEQVYCSLIARLALNGAGYHIANHFNKSLTLKRIAMIKSDKLKVRWWKLAATAPVGLLFFFFVSCEQQSGNEPVREIEVAADDAAKEIFTVVEELPAFPGGMNNLYKYFSTNLTYPPQAKAAGTEGKVFVEFVVNKNGTVSDAKVIKGIGSGCDEEAIRVVTSSPEWTPALQRGKKVRTRMILPVFFTLDGNVELEVPATPTIVGEPLKVTIKKSEQNGSQTVITGVVATEDGEEIPGASIILTGTTSGTVSDLDGSFRLVTESKSGALAVSFVGYKTEEIAF